MTTFLLVRHGLTDAIGNVMAGWQPGWHLNTRGREQAERLAEKMQQLPIRAVYTSPLERAVETAEPIARVHGLKPQIMEEVGEIRIGEWEGLTMAQLNSREDWKRFNKYRSGVRCPGGEFMFETQARMAAALDLLRRRHTEETLAVVSHGDPIRSVLMHYLGSPIDLIHRFTIDPGSVSVVEAAEWGARVVCMNGTGDPRP